MPPDRRSRPLPGAAARQAVGTVDRRSIEIGVFADLDIHDPVGGVHVHHQPGKPLQQQLADPAGNLVGAEGEPLVRTPGFHLESLPHARGNESLRESGRGGLDRRDIPVDLERLAEGNNAERARERRRDGILVLGRESNKDPVERLVDGELQSGQLRPYRVLEAPDERAAIALLQCDFPVFHQEQVLRHAPRPRAMESRGGISCRSTASRPSI